MARRSSARLLVAPTDLRAIDGFVADEMLFGRYLLAGRVVEAGDFSPFALPLPSELFAVRLHSFSWLRHLRGNKSEENCAKARTVIDDWITRHGRRRSGVSWDLDVAAQRLIAWLCHSPIVLHSASAGFYRRYLTSLNQQVRFLRQAAQTAPDGLPRLRARIAIAMASVSMECSAGTMRAAGRALDRELDRQILPDGGHVSRNPQVLLELLFDLLPLRQTYINLGHDVPPKLIPAIDRIYPALRFFRHADGDLALFNGATSVLANDLMAVLRYDETAGQPFKALPHSQFQRLSAGETTVIVDTGFFDSADLSRNGHAGCLSFELSSGRNRFIVNSGAPRFAGNRFRQLARETAAHSTVGMADRASCRISRSPFLGPIFTDGVTKVDLTRDVGPETSDRLTASHNGYLGRFGVLHERQIRLSADGSRLLGRDRIVLPDGELANGIYPDPAIARFHVHPAITLTQIDENTLRLEAANGECWIFNTIAGKAGVGEDIFFADPAGVRHSEQIELHFDGPEVVWSLTHHHA
ncbi:putative heparinase superfamily protein [Rhizobium halophytocola]|uniref:Heparinase superfamily protein n=1 Tax=Rhizobium halophytocola TaxID=735519 RepID=A0ABS4E1P9_9HYPH|nr:putative heparinase superfamily protein [Rhizobium halophytocola]